MELTAEIRGQPKNQHHASGCSKHNTKAPYTAKAFSSWCCGVLRKVLSKTL